MTRCPTCDRQLATRGCAYDMLRECPGGQHCHGIAVDWRARALVAESDLRTESRDRVDDINEYTARIAALETALGEALNWINDRSDEEPTFVTRLRSILTNKGPI